MRRNNVRQTWTITPAADTAADGCDHVRYWLREHNWKMNAPFMAKLSEPEHDARPLVLLAKAEGQVVGGLFAETQLAWLRISIMSVDPNWRSQGIGAALLMAAESEAKRRGCRHAYADTMEYQAPSFYAANGYHKVGEVADWDSRGHRKLFFAKELC